MGFLDRQSWIELDRKTREVILYFRSQPYDFYTRISQSYWMGLIANLCRQKHEQGRTKCRILCSISAKELTYADDLKLHIKYAQGVSEKSKFKRLIGILGAADSRPSRTLVAEMVLMSVNSFNIFMPRKTFFKLRDRLIIADRKIRRIRI